MCYPARCLCAGCYALTDEAFQPLRKNEKLRSLNLSPSAITLTTPFFGDRNEPLQVGQLLVSECVCILTASYASYAMFQLSALDPPCFSCQPVTYHVSAVSCRPVMFQLSAIDLPCFSCQP